MFQHVNILSIPKSLKAKVREIHSLEAFMGDCEFEVNAKSSTILYSIWYLASNTIGGTGAQKY